MPETRLVIFDHDGLMVNSEEVVFATLQHLLRTHQHDFTWQYYIGTLGLPVAESLRIYLRDFPLPLTYEEFSAAYYQHVADGFDRDLRLMPGLVALLDLLRARGVPLAVATSGTRDYIERTLRRFDLRDYFQAVVCIDDVARGKPHPDLVLRALDVTHTQPEDAIMLEDAPNGVEAAHGAGVFAVAVPTQGIDLNAFRRASIIATDLIAVRRLFEVGWPASAGKMDR
jgi:HAD superfamily hydrolase (TIGR01509 family)